MLNNLQSYIFDNINHLKKHGYSDIIIITDKKFNPLFKENHVINIEDLIDDYVNVISTMSNTFRNGFGN